MRKLALAVMTALLLVNLVAAPVAAAVPTTTNPYKLYVWVTSKSCPSCAYQRLSDTQRKAFKSYLKTSGIKTGPIVNAPSPSNAVMQQAADDLAADTAAAVATTGSGGCQNDQFYNVTGYGDIPFRHTVWEYWMITDRCWAGGPWPAGSVRDGAVFTSTHARVYPDRMLFFITYTPQVRNDSGGDGKAYWTAYAEAQFQICIVSGFGCTNANYPHITFRSPYPGANYLSSFQWEGGF
jgi:hypothetical protein